MKWTDQQWDAIRTKHRSVIVSAAAGSGKTAVLVERLLQILSDPSPDTRVPADEMIVVTFTRDAAAQMKQRLTKKISETLDRMNREGHHQEAAYDWLLQQRSALSNAKISTIHSFCFDFIRENADACGVYAQFGVAEPAREYVFKKRAVQTVLERWSKDRRDDITLLLNRLCTAGDSELENLILLIAEYKNSLAFPSYWTEQAKKICQEENNTVFLDMFRQTFAQEIQECISLAEKCRPFATAAYSDPNKMVYENIRKNDIKLFETCREYILHAEPEKLLADPFKAVGSFDAFRGGSSKSDYYDEDNKAIFKNIRGMYQKKYKALKEKLLEPLGYWKDDEIVQKQIIPLMLEMTEEYQQELFEEKKKQNVLSFSDAEHLVLNLLASVDENGLIHRSALAEAAAEKYELIMIDEYQDSNDKQDCLFKLLSRNCRVSEDGTKLHYGTNAFLVGDVKQSIYGFRQANPENFKRAIQESTPLEQCKDQEMARIYLNQNFRSAPGILNFINSMFRLLMSEQCGGLVYDVHEQLNFGAEVYQRLEKEYQGVQILIPQSDSETPVEDLELECLADTIANMIAEKFPVMQSDGTVRPCEYKDFSVLMRSVDKAIDQLREVFRRRKIPFSYDDGGFLTFPEIQFIINLLKVIDNPMTDVAMAGTLLSPVYGFMPEDLAMLKVSGSGRRIYLQMQSLTESKDSVLAQKSELFLQQLAQMRLLADTMPLEKFIYEIYDMTDLMSVQSLYEHADERREHLEVFAQYARSYQEHADIHAQCSLSGYIRYLDYLRESEKPVSSKKSGQKADCVSVTTIHGSKGLEYPFVFLLHTDDEFRYKPPADPLLTAENGLIGMKTLDKETCIKISPASYQYLHYLHDKQERSEEMRLLYVALTRAKQKLFLITDEIYTDHVSDKHICCTGGFLEHCPETVSDFVTVAGSVQEWILGYLFASDEAEYIRKITTEKTNINSPMAEYRVWKMQKSVLDSAAEQKTGVSAVPEQNLILKMQNQLAYQYDASLTNLPAKRTVTSLSHSEITPEDQTEIPDFMLEDEEGRIRRLKGAARGTAIHKIMQFMDFKAASENLAQEITRMQNAQILQKIETEAIQPEKIQAFFHSDLYHRIAESDTVLKEKQLFVQMGRLNLPEDSVLRKYYAGTDGIMIGTVDLLFREPDGWVIVDYKTDRIKETGYYIEKYAVQLGLYQNAMELVLGEPVRQAYIYSFTLDQAIEINLSEIDYHTISGLEEAL